MFWKKKKKIKVFYICQYIQGWNKIADVINSMIDDDEIDIHILAFPMEINKFPENEEFLFWKNKFGDYVINAVSNNEWFDLKKENPDYVFVQRPYDIYLPEKYSCKELAKYTKLCYIPYGFILAKLQKVTLQKEFLENLYMFFADNHYEYEYAKDIIESFNDNNKRLCFDLGYPILDAIKEKQQNYSAFKQIKKRNLNIIWTPRWTTDEEYCGTTFFENKDKIVEYGKRNDCLIVFRPHPLAFDNFISKGLMTKKEVTNYLKNYQNSNMIYDKSGDYYDTFKDSDVLITDFSSIVVEYLLFNKPIILCGGDIKNKYNHIMKKIRSVCYNVKNWNEIESILIKLNNGNDTKRKKRTNLIKELFGNYDGMVSKRIVNCIKNDYYKR